MLPLLAIVAALLAPLFAAPGASAQQVRAEEYVLDNGMHFLLVPRTEEPNVVAAGWVAKVGSVNERPGITGISHFFEHMMFKGTTTIGTTDPDRDAEFMAQQKTVKDRINQLVWTTQYERARRGEIDDPWDAANDTDELSALRAELRDLIEAHRDVIVQNEFDQIYTNAGASGMNAFTSEDMTFYFINVPSNKVELWAWMESDRLNDSVFREFYAERDVVHEERRTRLESNPTGRLDEQFRAMFWQSAPYSWEPIGWPSDLNSYSREQFDAYFDVYYRPNNLVGVIVGDFDPAEVKPLLASYFGRLERGTQAPPPVVTLEVEPLAAKRLDGECECQPQVEVRYHTVPFNHRDEFALEVLSGLLNGRTGRLYESMVEGAEIASSARAGQSSLKYGGYFSFSARVKGDATPEDLERAWYAEVRRIQEEPIPASELQKVRNRIAADSYRRLQRNSALLFQLGIYAAMGDWEYINDSPVALAAVTVADIKRVATTYFAPERRCVAIYRRRAGDGGGTGLASLPAEMRQQIAFMQKQFEDKPVEELEQVLGMMRAQRSAVPAGQIPPEAMMAMEYMERWLQEKIDEKRAAGDGDAESGDG